MPGSAPSGSVPAAGSQTAPAPQPRKVFFVSGEIALPGQTYLDLRVVTLLQALAEAGGVTSSAGPDVVVRRHRDPTVMTATTTDDPTVQTLTFNRDDLMSGKVKDPELQAGDTVVVPKATATTQTPASAKHVLVNGEVRVPQAVVWHEGMTIQQAIDTAGGATAGAATGRIYIMRLNPKTKKLDRVTKGIKLTTPVQADDTIVVPHKYFGAPSDAPATLVQQPQQPHVVLASDVKIQATSVTVSGEVMNPGKVEFKDGMTVHQAIDAAGGAKRATAATNRIGIKRFNANTGKYEDVKAVKDTTLLKAGDIVTVPKKRIA
jgi:protein involved in polysaccharide export with SLBB domain